MRQNKQEYLYKFNENIRLAKIDGRAKGLLQFYANVFNWKTEGASFYSQRQICALMGMSQSTYQEKRDYLERLGWLRVQYRGRNKPCKVWVCVGQDDPNYETKSWAKWHPKNESDLQRWFREEEIVDIEVPDYPPNIIEPIRESIGSRALPQWFWD